MTKLAADKKLATAISLSIALAFVATSKTHATTQFPPEHTTATFAERHDANDTPVVGSYYRPNSEQSIAVRIRNGNVELAYSNVRISPYYRAAN